jgi:chaperone required for assembly of F1-ATPase
MSVKRFYSDVALQAADGGFQVTLDGRPVKTVKGAPQLVSSEALARALAAEWEAQGETLDPASMPFRDMTDYTIDIVHPDRGAVIDKILPYGETDTLLYRADPDEPLYARQQEVWEPIVAGFEKRHGAQFTRISGIIHRPQSETTLASFRSLLSKQDPFSLTALEMTTSLSASLITALSAAEDGADALALWNAASLEEEWQAELWGRDEEAETRRARREADFLKAIEFQTLARS